MQIFRHFLFGQAFGVWQRRQSELLRNFQLSFSIRHRICIFGRLWYSKERRVGRYSEDTLLEHTAYIERKIGLREFETFCSSSIRMQSHSPDRSPNRSRKGLSRKFIISSSVYDFRKRKINKFALYRTPLAVACAIEVCLSHSVHTQCEHLVSCDFRDFYNVFDLRLASAIRSVHSLQAVQTA